MGTRPPEQALVGFDYAPLGNLSDVVQGIAKRVRLRMKRAAEDIIEIGQSLIEAKRLLKHGQFGEWLRAEFDWSHQTAARFMQVADRFRDISQIVNFAPSALYLLSSPSVPDEAIAEVVERAETGEKITVAAANETIERHTAEADDEPCDEPQPDPARAFDVVVFGRLIEAAIDRVLNRTPSQWHELLAERLEVMAAEIRETGGISKT